MRIISWNVNGLRAVYKRNFLEWFRETGADVICLQEIKAQRETVPPELLNVENYFSCFNFAEKPGYAGVAVYAKIKPKTVKNKLGIARFDSEGRFLELDYEDFILINLYLPHGGRGKENLGYKLEVYEFLIGYLKKIKDKPVILIGDFNIAHEDVDLARPKNNRDNIMFTPEERKRIDEMIELGFIDTFRKFHEEGGHYTWWPYFADARQRNLGWRIDYIFVSQSLAPRLHDAFILKDIKGSDHCPIGAAFSPTGVEG